MTALHTIQFALRLLLAIALGGTVGLERQWRHRMAGTRTNALVAAGAASFIMAGFLLPEDLSARGRVLSYIVSGVGFLGAGVIFKENGSVRGLNTAATIWCSAAVGALSGLGAWPLAVVLTVGILFTNLVLRPLAYRLQPILPEAIPAETRYAVKLTVAARAADQIRGILIAKVAQGALSLQGMQSREDEDAPFVHLTAVLRSTGSNPAAVEDVVLRLSIEDRVSDVSWSVVETAMEE